MSTYKLGYLVASISYVIFLTLDWLRPGFVSNVFSPHLFLFAAIVFGVLWARQQSLSNRGFVWPFAIVAGLLLTLFTWTEGRELGDMRILVTFVAFLLPWIMIKLLKADD